MVGTPPHKPSFVVARRGRRLASTMVRGGGRRRGSPAHLLLPPPHPRIDLSGDSARTYHHVISDGRGLRHFLPFCDAAAPAARRPHHHHPPVPPVSCVYSCASSTKRRATCAPPPMSDDMVAWWCRWWLLSPVGPAGARAPGAPGRPCLPGWSWPWKYVIRRRRTRGRAPWIGWFAPVAFPPPHLRCSHCCRRPPPVWSDELPACRAGAPRPCRRRRPPPGGAGLAARRLPRPWPRRGRLRTCTRLLRLPRATPRARWLARWTGRTLFEQFAVPPRRRRCRWRACLSSSRAGSSLLLGGGRARCKVAPSSISLCPGFVSSGGWWTWRTRAK